MSETQDENPPPPPPPTTQQTPTQQTPHTVSTIKLPILKKGKYDIWAMKMEHYLAHTDYPIWETDAKEMWIAIKSRFGWKSMTQNKDADSTFLKANCEDSIVSKHRWIHNGYERFQVFSSVRDYRAEDYEVANHDSSTAIIFNLQNVANVAFISENTSSTNDVSTAYGVSNTSGHTSKHEQTS
ncbi:hypothetical protein Tco_0261852 [Tanacetum coccineum]